MTYFKDIDKLSKYDNLLHEIQKLDLVWGVSNQICLNTIIGKEDDYQLGAGSLLYDLQEVKDSFNNTKLILKEFETTLNEEDFTIICNQFKNTTFETIYRELEKRYFLGRVRLMRSEPKTCLSWHRDSTPRIHYPIKTQLGCFMIINDEVKFMEESKWYWADTTELHTAINASKDSRIHLVATILGEK